MYVDLSSIHTKQTTANYKTVQARLLSLYTKNNVIADDDTNFTFYSQQLITYTYDNPYIPPQVFPPVVNQQTRTVLFGLMPPTDAVISTPMDCVIPALPAPPTNMQPSLQPGRVGGPNPDSLGDRGGDQSPH